MTAVIKGILDEDLPDLRTAVALHESAGRLDLVSRNLFSGLEQSSVASFCALREDAAPNLKLVNNVVSEWYARFLQIDANVTENVCRYAQVIGEMGFLTNRSPQSRELDFFAAHKPQLDTISTIAWNLYTGAEPGELLPKPAKQMKQYVDLLLGLTSKDLGAIREFEIHYARRENVQFWARWHGGGPLNSQYLDPLALCLLKFSGEQFTFETPHIIGLNNLRAAGF